MDILKILGMLGFSILMLLIQVYLVAIVYQDLSKWTIFPYLSYAKILCLVVFVLLVKALLADNILALQAYESLSKNYRIAKQLSETIVMGLFVLIYFVAKRWVV